MDRLVWAATTTYAAEGWHLGVRTSDHELDAALREVFADRVVADPPRPAPPNFSLWRPTGGTGGAASRLPTLYRGCTPVLRSRSVRRLVYALDGQLQDHRRVLRDDVVVVQALAAVVPGTTTAAVLPRSVRYLQPALPQLLERLGLDVVDGMVVNVCPTGALLVDPPSADVGDGAVSDALGPPLPGRGSASPGRYDIAAWWTYGPTTGRAALLVQTMRHHVRNGGRVGGAQTLEALAAALRGVTVCRVPSSAPGEVDRVAREVARHLRDGAGTARGGG